MKAFARRLSAAVAAPKVSHVTPATATDSPPRRRSPLARAASGRSNFRMNSARIDTASTTGGLDATAFFRRLAVYLLGPLGIPLYLAGANVPRRVLLRSQAVWWPVVLSVLLTVAFVVAGVDGQLGGGLFITVVVSLFAAVVSSGVYAILAPTARDKWLMAVTSTTMTWENQVLSAKRAALAAERAAGIRLEHHVFRFQGSDSLRLALLAMEAEARAAGHSLGRQQQAPLPSGGTSRSLKAAFMNASGGSHPYTNVLRGLFHTMHGRHVTERDFQLPPQPGRSGSTTSPFLDDGDDGDGTDDDADVYNAGGVEEIGSVSAASADEDDGNDGHHNGDSVQRSPPAETRLVGACADVAHDPVASVVASVQSGNAAAAKPDLLAAPRVEWTVCCKAMMTEVIRRCLAVGLMCRKSWWLQWGGTAVLSFAPLLGVWYVGTTAQLVVCACVYMAMAMAVRELVLSVITAMQAGLLRQWVARTCIDLINANANAKNPLPRVSFGMAGDGGRRNVASWLTMLAVVRKLSANRSYATCTAATTFSVGMHAVAVVVGVVVLLLKNFGVVELDVVTFVTLALYTTAMVLALLTIIQIEAKVNLYNETIERFVASEATRLSVQCVMLPDGHRDKPHLSAVVELLHIHTASFAVNVVRSTLLGITIDVRVLRSVMGLVATVVTSFLVRRQA